jgi:hypothetical protein
VAPEVGGIPGAQEDRRVVVHAEEVQLLADRRQVAVGDQRERREQPLRGVLRVLAVQHRPEVDAVRRRVGDQPSPLELTGPGLAEDPDRMQVQGDADLGRARGAQCLGGQPVAEQQVMGGGGRGVGVAQARGVVAVAVAVGRDDLRLVQGDPAGDPVPERVGRERGVLGKPFGRIPRGPAALVLQFLRQVPVEERGRGGDAVLAEFVEQGAVVVQAPLVGGAPAAGLDPRPGDGEPVGGQAEGGDQRDVLAVAVVGVTGDIAGIAAADLARGVAEGVPHRRALAVRVRRSLDLVGGRRCSPDEPFWEAEGAFVTCRQFRHQPLLVTTWTRSLSRGGHGP